MTRITHNLHLMSQAVLALRAIAVNRLAKRAALVVAAATGVFIGPFGATLAPVVGPSIAEAATANCYPLVGTNGVPSPWPGPIGSSGVPVCSNFNQAPTIYVSPVGTPWQCVELAQR